MVLALVLLTLVVCVAIDIIRSRGAVTKEASRPVAGLAPGGTKVIERHFHPGHSWALFEGTTSAKVGADDLAQRFMANLESIEVPEKGTAVRQGEPLVTFRQGKRALTLASPISGILAEVNSRLLGNPSLLKSSPYEKGWIARIIPSNLGGEIGNLFRGALAERWREGVQEQIAAMFSRKLGTVLQDGGQWVDDLGGLLNDEEWQEVVQKLFIRTSEQSNIH